ncbi:arylsulfatase [Adhaeribacter radiodurans]|uniref:Arylsulfatase n=1 Tax=Adhaeribacter radiodurans TaxID=2745197 RepID=A0A7L7L7E5_9BACT|nr:arylsulfatase [Adhaeribacter radiodurans]QMU28762.1 arylsulfatase [Adhaeribacter radiodurans]
MPFKTKTLFQVSIFLFGIILFLPTWMVAQSRPNVILILTDDQGWGDLSLHNNPWVETPHLDSLAKRGKEFTHFYVSPLCAPSRASILTGRHHLSTGVLSVSKGLEIMDPEETTLAELFKANGYRTGIFGKWHNGQHYPSRPNDQGFDEFLGFSAGHLSNYFNTNLEKNAAKVKTKGYITDVLTNAALQFITDNKNKPFFCYIPYNAPHAPFQVPDRYFNKYKDKGLNNELAAVYGMVDNIDENVGKILQYLKQNKLEENTIVLFLSDNGPNGHRFNDMMKGIKGSVHEGGVRAPFFISWKNHIQADQNIDVPIANVDIYPTLSELCKLTSIPGKPIAGMSLVPLLLNNGVSFKANRNLYTHVNFMTVPVDLNAGGFRNSQYRLVYENDKPQLYDLRRDPEEKTDLASVNSQLVNQFTDDYKKWFTAVSANLMYNRPIVVSQKGVALPTYEASLTAGIKFKEGHGWAHDWIERWNTTTDSISWEINCQDSGKYRVEIEYLCKKTDVGSRIVCRIGKESKPATIKNAFYSAQIPSPDRVPRKEAYEVSSWKRMEVGTYYIASGKQLVTLRALQVSNKNVAEINSINLVPVD